MADFESKINLNVDATQAIAAIKVLQERISAFHSSMAKSGGFANAELAKMRTNLVASINATGSYRASMTEVVSATDAFTTALEKNKLTMGETFRYTMGSTKLFGRFFRNEMEMVNKVARERTKTIQTSYLKMGRDVNGAMQAIKVRPLVLDLKNLETQMMMNAQRIQVMNKLIDTGSTQLLNFGKNTQWAGRQLMVGFTVPLTMLGTIAAKTFMDMEKEVVKFQRVYGDFSTSVQETDKMVASIKELATEFTKFGVAAKDTMSLAAEAAAAGFQGKALIDQVTNASRLAVLGQIDQQQAYETTISVTNAFGIATEDLAGKIDFLNAVENQTVTSISDLTEAIPKAAPVIQQLGGDVEDLAFFLTAMKEGGINASEGANALKSGLAAIINPTQKASDMLKGMGVNLKDIVDSNVGDVKQMIIDLGNALNDLDPLNRAQAIEQLFGKFQFSRISTLLQNVTKEGTQAQKVLGLANASAAELAVLSKRELDKVQSSTTFKFQAAWEKFQQALAPVGEQFLKAVTPILDFGTKLLQQFNSWSDGSKNFAMGLTAALGVVGPTLLMAIGLVANGIANLMKFFAFLSRMFTGATKDSATLGMETRYMTEAQLNAAAAATSLGQTHSKLQQIYTSETESLVALTAALNRAVAAQERFGAAGGGALTKRGKAAPKKYAEGVVMVPGPKGAGDIVPAMLAPGEAVIPADMAQKYSGLINGMVAGNIPGYEDGTTGAKKRKNVPFPETVTGQAMHLTEPTAYMPADELLGQFDKEVQKLIKDGILQASDITLDQVNSKTGRSQRQAIESAGSGRLLSSLVGLAGSDINQLFKNDSKKGAVQQKVSAKDARSHMQRTGGFIGTNLVGTMDWLQQKGRGVEGGMPADKDIKKLLGDIEKTLDTKLGALKDTPLNEKELNKVIRESFKEAIAANKNKSVGQLADRAMRLMESRTQVAVRNSGGSSGRTTYSPIKGFDANRFSASGGRGLNIVERVLGKKSPFSEKGHFEVNANDPKAMKAAQDAQKMLNELAKNKDPRAKILADRLGASGGDPAKIKKALDEVKKMSSEKAKPAAAPKVTKKPRSPQAKGFSQVQDGIWADEHGNTYKDGKYYDQEGKKTTIKEMEEKKAIQSSRRGRRGGMGAIGAGAAIAGVGMAAGTPLDKTIENAMTGSMLTMMLPQKIAGKAAILVTALLSLKDVIDAFNEKMRKAVESGANLANSFGTTNQKLTAMGEQLGTVGATDIQRYKNDEMVAGISDPVALAEGKKLLQSDIGKQTLDDFRNVMTQMGRDQAVQTLASQLGMYVAQGIMTPEQAKSFAYAIGQEVGNTTITADVNMKVNELIGPNGEKLSNEPLKVVLEIQAMNVNAFQAAIGQAQAGYQSPVTPGNAALGALGYAQTATGLSITGKGLSTVASEVGEKALGKEATSKFAQLALNSLAGQMTKINLAGKAMSSVGARLLPVVGEKIAGIVFRKMALGAAKLAGGALAAETGVGVAVAVAGAIDIATGVWEIGAAVADYNKALENNAKIGAYAAQMGMNLLQQNEQLKDVLATQYDQKLAELDAQLITTKDAKDRKKIEEDINKLIEERNTAQAELQANSAKITDNVLGYLMQDTGRSFGENGLLQKQSAITYKDNPIAQDAANAAINQVDQMGLKDTKFGVTVALQVAYGNIDPTTAATLISAGQASEPLRAGFELLVTSKGLEESSTVMQLIGRAMQGGMNKDMNIPVMLNMMSNSGFDVQSLASLVDLSAKSDGITLVNESNLIKTQSLFDQLERVNTNVRKQDLMSINEQTGGQFQYILDNWEELSGTDNLITKDVLVNYQVAGGDNNAVWKWINANGLQDSLGSGASKEQLIATYRVKYIASLEMDGETGATDTRDLYKTVTKTSSGGSGEDPELKRLQDQQDKKQKALDVIAIREDRINKKYDERKKALQDIADAQAEITAQQQSQMDLADALSKGDVAAAARAAQAIQSKNAETAVSNQQKSLENARKSELDNVSFRGMTRGGLEPQLDKLKELIAIREYELSPKKNSGGGGGTYQVQEKTPKPGYDAQHKQGEGEWVEDKKSGKWIWKPSPKAVAPATADGLSHTAAAAPKSDWFSDSMKNVEKWATDFMNQPWVKSIQAIFIGTGEIFNEFVIVPIQQFFTDVGNWINENIVVPWNNMVAQIKAWWDENISKPINDFFTMVGNWIYEHITTPWNNMVTAISTWWNDNIATPINNFFTSVSLWIDEHITQPFNRAIAWVQEKFGLFFSWFNEDKSMKEKIDDVKKWWKDTIDSVSTWWKELPDKIGKWFGSIGTTIKDSFVTAVNGAIEALNKWKFKIPAFEIIPGQAWTKVGGQTWDPFDIPHIKLNEGGQVPGIGNTDTVPAMLTPGEFVINKESVKDFGAKNLASINSGSSASDSGSVYNYSVVVNAATGANADDIANVAIAKLRAMESRRIGGNR
jgi:TP901 family phage tail tape measure protein